MHDLHTRMKDAEARVESLICIAAMLGDGFSLAEPLQDFLDDEAEIFDRLFPHAPHWLRRDLDAGGADAFGAFYEYAWSSGKLGFLLQIATPVMEWTSKTSSNFSWGHYATHWVYADTFDAAIEAGLAWVAERRTVEQSKL